MPQRSLVPAVQKIRLLKLLLNETRQVATVIEVGVRQDDGVELRGAERQRLPVALAASLQPLEQPTVDQHLRRSGIEQTLSRSPSLRRRGTSATASSEESYLSAGVPGRTTPSRHRRIPLPGMRAIKPAIALAV